MNAAMRLFKMGVRQILSDGMLFVMLPAPFLMGGAFRLLLPVLNRLLAAYFAFSLEPYYILFDTLVIVMTPMMTALVFAFLMLEERDQGIGDYYVITPAGGRAYLFARLVLPMLWSAVSSIFVWLVFGLAGLPAPTALWLIVISTLQSVSLSMLLVILAGNKVEGLALSKLMGLVILGLPAAYFVRSPLRYVLAFLPSFWMGELLKNNSPRSLNLYLCGVAGMISCAGWIFVLKRRFLNRI